MVLGQDLAHEGSGHHRRQRRLLPGIPGACPRARSWLHVRAVRQRRRADHEDRLNRSRLSGLHGEVGSARSIEREFPGVPCLAHPQRKHGCGDCLMWTIGVYSSTACASSFRSCPWRPDRAALSLLGAGCTRPAPGQAGGPVPLSPARGSPDGPRRSEIPTGLGAHPGSIPNGDDA